MSVVSYNGITLPYSYTTYFNQTALREESNTDFYATKYEIQIQTILNTAFIESLPEKYRPAGTDSPAAILRAVRHDLLAPRKQFSFVYNTVEMIPRPIALNQGTVDCQNGPKPEFCQITQMSDDTFLMIYRITAVYWDVYNTDQDLERTAVSSVLYNRWTETVDIDTCAYTTKTRQGVYCIRSDNRDGSQADTYRENMAVLGIPPGFVRESSSYTISKDGLSLSYRVTDKEVYKPPTSPAYRATGKYIETTTKLGGIYRSGEVSVRLEGAKSVPQDRLLKAALLIAINKVRWSGNARVQQVINDDTITTGFRGAKFFGFLEYAAITVDLFNNIVDVVIRCRLAPEKGRLFGLAGLNDYTYDPKSNKSLQQQDEELGKRMCDTYGTAVGSKQRRLYKSRGTANILLEAAKYYDPSIASTRLGDYALPSSSDPIPYDEVTQLDKGKRIGEAGKEPE